MKEIRTRFAPSPTGFLHIGSMRTAAYAWLAARHYGGTFILRIEDTDKERKVPGAIRGIFDELKWCGIVPDEAPGKEELKLVGEDWDEAPDIGGPCGPYIQSLRLERYKKYAEQLVEKGVAYRCDCTPEMIEKERNEQMARKELPGYSGYCRTRNVPADVPHAIRFKIPARVSLTLDDAIRGKIVWDQIPMRDQVILKTDGYPTYNFAVVIDDHEMKITHVMRGDEFISTTPLHLLLWEALGWQPPVYAHLPVILGTDGKKLSKRTGSTFTSNFRDEGYLPEAIRNFVILVGWSPGKGEEQEVFSEKELIERFTIEGINDSNGVFDDNKLMWMNGIYMRNLDTEKFIELALPFIEKTGLKVEMGKLRKIAPFVKERVKLLTEVAPMIEFLFVDQIERDIPKMFKKGVDQTKAIEVMEKSLAVLEKIEPFTHDVIEPPLRSLAEEVGLKVGVMFTVLRIAVTGKEITPPLFESFETLGKEVVLRRLGEALPLVREFKPVS